MCRRSPSQVLRTSALVPSLKKPRSWLFLNSSQVLDFEETSLRERYPCFGVDCAEVNPDSAEEPTAHYSEQLNCESC